MSFRSFWATDPDIVVTRRSLHHCIKSLNWHLPIRTKTSRLWSSLPRKISSLKSACSKHCNYPSSYLSQLQLTDVHGDAEMQHVSKRNLNPRAVGEGLVSLKSIRNGRPELNFTETLPTEMSVKIFSELDVRSLCRASVTCKRWNVIIEGSDNLWRGHCLSALAVCRREVDGDRSDGLSWKVTLVRNYQKSCVKRRWLKGKYSNILCGEDLPPNSMCPLDVETWGEILEAELER